MRTTLIRRSAVAIALTATLMLPMSACGGDGDQDTVPTPPAGEVTSPDEQAPDVTTPDATTPDATTPDAATPDATTPDSDAADRPDAPGADLLPVVAYFQLDERVSPVRRHIDPLAGGMLAETLATWLAGPTADEVAAGYSTTVPAGTQLLGATYENNVVRVDLSAEFATGGGSAMMLGRLAELVMTASTQVVMLDGVELLIDGEVVSVFSSEGIEIDGLLTVEDVAQQLPAIIQSSVLPGDEISDGQQISGWADVPDAVVSVQLVDAGGAAVHESTVTASCGDGCLGRFTTWVDTGGHTGPATLRLFHAGSDGTETATVGVVEVPITVEG